MQRIFRWICVAHMAFHYSRRRTTTRCSRPRVSSNVIVNLAGSGVRGVSQSLLSTQSDGSDAVASTFRWKPELPRICRIRAATDVKRRHAFKSLVKNSSWAGSTRKSHEPYRSHQIGTFGRFSWRMKRVSGRVPQAPGTIGDYYAFRKAN